MNFRKRWLPFKANIGRTDRIIRLVVGIVLIILTLKGVIGFWGWFGVLVIMSALVSFCSLYVLFGIDTTKR